MADIIALRNQVADLESQCRHYARGAERRDRHIWRLQLAIAACISGAGLAFWLWVMGVL